jgi:hypothetical protein
MKDLEMRNLGDRQADAPMDRSEYTENAGTCRRKRAGKAL